MTTCAAGDCGTGGVGLPMPGDPSNDGTLSAKSSVGGIELSWQLPTVGDFAVAYTTVYRSITNQFINAMPITKAGGTEYFDRVAAGTQYWYWIEFVSVQGTVMPLIGPATAIAYDSVAAIIKDLTGRIDSSVLALALKERIDSITTVEGNLLKEIQDRFGADSALAGAVQLLQSDVDGALTVFEQEVIQRRDADTALVDAVSLMGVKVDGNRAAILEEATVRASEDEALASRITTLEASGDNGELAQVEQRLEAKIDAVDGKASSLYTVKLTAGNLIGGFGLYNDGVTVLGGFDVDTFFIGRTNTDMRKPFMIHNGITYMDQALIRELTVDKITSGNMGAEWKMTGQNARIVMDNGLYMKVIGNGFGAQGNLVEWFGPSMPIAQCSTANAKIYETTNGDAYYGGSLRAGVLYNAQRTSQIAFNAEVPCGPFWSNGNVKNVVLSYNFGHGWRNTNSNTWNNNGYTYTGGEVYAVVELHRSFNDGPYTLLRSATFYGSIDIINEVDAPDSASSTITGSFTLTDNVGAGNYTYLARIVARSNANFSHPNGLGTLTVVQSLGIVSTEE